MGMRDVYNVVRRYGSTISILQQTEAATERDDYGSIINRTPTTITVNAFPVELDPSEKKLFQLGINEQVNALFYLSKMECDELGVTFDTVNTILHTVQWMGVEYKLTQKRLYSQFGNQYLYIVLAGLRN